MQPTSKFLLAFALCTAGPVMAQSCFNTTPPGTLLGSSQDTVFPMQPIGFAFPLAGTTYSNIHVSDHGLVFLSNNAVPVPPTSGSALLYTPATATLTTGSPKICALWSDTVGATPGAVYIDSSAAQCTVTWSNVQSFGLPTPRFSLQMKLLPSGEVEFAWSATATNNSTFGGASQVGIVGITPGGGVALPAGLDLSVGGATADNTCFEAFPTANTFDMQNTGMRLVPTSPGWVALPLGSASCAATSNYGAGCGALADSIYESFTTPTFDLANSTITWLRTPGGYTVLNALPGTFVTPSGTAVNVAAGQLDGQQSFTLSAPMPVPGGTTTTLNITTKGQIEVSGPVLATIDYTPTVAELLARANTVFCCWHDFNQTQTGSGLIKYEEVGGFAYATWDGVNSYGGTSAPSTFQFQFELATGNVTLVFGTTAGLNQASNPDAIVVGYSFAGASVDPGTSDLSGTLLTTVFDGGPTSGNLSLTANGLPTIGNAGFSYTITNVPNLIPLAFLFFGTLQVNPGLDLSFLNMPGCRAYTNANLTSVSVPAAGGSATVPLVIPSNPSLAGVQLSSQGLAFSLVNTANLISSNGTLITVGN